MILKAFECPIVKRGQLQSYLILSSKVVFKNRNVFFYIIGMIPTTANRLINSVDVKVFFRVEREKLNLNSST